MFKFKLSRKLKKKYHPNRKAVIETTRDVLVPMWFGGATLWVGSWALWLFNVLSFELVSFSRLLGSSMMVFTSIMLYGAYRRVHQERIQGYAEDLKREFGKPLYGLRLKAFLFGDIWKAEERTVSSLQRYLGRLRRVRTLTEKLERDAKYPEHVMDLIYKVEGLWDHLTASEQANAIAFAKKVPTPFQFKVFLVDQLHRIAMRERDKDTSPRRAIELRSPRVKASKNSRPASQPERELAPSHSLTLTEVEEGLAIESLLPQSVDKVMAKAIVLELMDLGNRKTSFGESYRAEDTLKRMVVRRYASGKQQFDPRSFLKTLRWLRKESILCSKSKTDEEVFSLSVRPGLAATPDSAEVVRSVVKFYNQFSSPS